MTISVDAMPDAHSSSRLAACYAFVVRRAALSLGLLVLLSAPARSSPAADERFVPDAENAGSMTLAGRTWSASAAGVDVRLQRLTDDERTAYIEHVTGERIDPFRSPGGEAAGFETFLLRVRNLGDDGVSFNPSECWLSAGQRDVLLPLGLDDLGALYRQFEGDLPEAYDRVRSALLDTRATLAHGDAVSGLLVYRGLEPRTKRFHVDVKVVLPSGDVVQTSAPFRRADAKP
jgi:hypothetical protein